MGNKEIYSSLEPSGQEQGQNQDQEQVESAPFSDSEIEPTQDESSEQGEILSFGEDPILQALMAAADMPRRKRKAEAFLAPRRPLFSAFAKDSSLNFKPSGEISTFAFSHKDFTVLVPLEWFASDKYDDDELEFANYHELSHFADMRKNPKAYVGEFEREQKKADELAKEYLKSHPGVASQSAVSKFFQEELHSLYNMLDDIYVNDYAASRAHKYGSSEGRKKVVSLYKKLGYEKADSTKQPLHYQLACSLLRDAMVGKELGKTVVSEEVEKALSKKYFGRTIQEIVNEKLRPRGGISIDPAERYKVIRTVIEPVYLELLQKALEGIDNKDKDDDEDEAERTLGGGGEPSEDGAFNPFGEKGNRPGRQGGLLDDEGDGRSEVIKEVLDAFIEKDRVDSMSPEERAAYENEKRQKAFDEKHGISAEMRKEVERIKKQISEARHEMRVFWRHLVGKSIEFDPVVAHRQRRGRLNVGEVIRQYSQIVDAQQKGTLKEAQVYDRSGLERRIIDQPESIEVSLVVDCSGSMGSGGRVDMAKRTAALLLYSLKDFNDELNKTRIQTRSKLRADTQVICFGDTFSEVKPFDGASVMSNASDANIIKTISAINGDGGGTDDASPFWKIVGDVSADDKARIKSGKLRKIVFEITDGAPNDAAATAQAVHRLAQDGVVVVGFQIGSDIDAGGGEFRTVWGDGDNPSHPNAKGIVIGENLGDLPKKLMESLMNILGDIRI